MSRKTQLRKKGEYLWKPGDKARAVACYAATGSFTKSAAISGIPENTIRYWAKQDWFAEEILRAEKADTDELKSTFTRIAKIGAEQLEDRLLNGDEVVTKEGDVIKKKIGGRDLAIITNLAADQRRKQMEVPDTVTVQSTSEKLTSLMQEFVKFAKAKEIKGESTDVSEAIEAIEGTPAEMDQGSGESADSAGSGDTLDSSGGSDTDTGADPGSP